MIVLTPMLAGMLLSDAWLPRVRLDALVLRLADGLREDADGWVVTADGCSDGRGGICE